jgi:hypothetical protein
MIKHCKVTHKRRLKRWERFHATRKGPRTFVYIGLPWILMLRSIYNMGACPHFGEKTLCSIENTRGCNIARDRKDSLSSTAKRGPHIMFTLAWNSVAICKGFLTKSTRNTKHFRPPFPNYKMRKRAAATGKAQGTAWSTVHRRTTRGTGDTVTGPPTATGALTPEAPTAGATRHSLRPSPLRRITCSPRGALRSFRPASHRRSSPSRVGSHVRVFHSQSRRSGVPGTESHDIGPALPSMAPRARQLLFRRTRPSPDLVPSSVPLEQQATAAPRSKRNGQQHGLQCRDCLVRHVEKAPTAPTVQIQRCRTQVCL